MRGIKWRRSTAGLALSAMTASTILAACGSDSKKDGSDGEPIERPKIGLVLHFTAIDYFTHFTTGAEDAAEDVGAELEVVGTPTPDPPTGVRMFRDLVAKGKDGIAVIASPPDFWARPLEEAKDDGVTLIGTIETPGTTTDLQTTWVGDNGQQTGRTLASEIIETVDDPEASGTIVIGNGDPALATLKNRTDGLKSEFEAAFPNAEIVVAEVGLEPVANLSTWEALFQKYADDAIAFVADGEHSGANLAKVAASHPGDYSVGTVDMDVRTAEGIRDGFIDVAIGGVPYARGYVTIRLLAEALKQGVDMPGGWVDMCCEIATQENIDGILERLNSDDLTREYYKALTDDLFADLSNIPVRPLEDVNKTDLPAATEPNPWLE